MRATPSAIASTRHMAILGSAFLFFGLVGGAAERSGAIQRAAPTELQAIRLYVSVLLFEWASVFYVWKGIRRNDVQLLDLVAGRWPGLVEAATDIALAAAIWAVWIGIELLLPGTNQAVRTLLPQTAIETAVWIL